MESKLKHMEMIQDIIKRMASNSFALKGWSVTLVAGLFALASKDTSKVYYLITYIPIIVFWILDAYYLMQERLFRNLYNKIRNLSEDQIDFNMSTADKTLHTNKTTLGNCLTSGTILGFYCPLALVSAGIIVISSLI